ncbi:hypothetical protein L6164_026347 [Bauhinia variegata]|uniref:Uncharacterized protein n=1 Tax=Bauhinia variegata TaxID=167791 RepID=A0ACB9LPU9_BAUVA|nr:hypothetical protein L6164_026347 [Bauhinia variegata]
MSRKSKRVCFSPNVNEKPTMFLKNGSGGGGGRLLGNRKKIIGTWTSRLPKEAKLSPVRFLLRLGAKVARAIRVVSVRRKASRSKVSSSSFVWTRSSSDHTDSHRVEVVEDCIEFLHSSSSRERPS